MKVYTRTGDQGQTSLFAGGRVYKHDLRVEAYGTVDELNAVVGVICSYALPDLAQTWLTQIQNDLFVIGSDLATPLDAKADWLKRIDATPAQQLESWIDTMDEQLAPLQTFILPGGTAAAAMTHVARTVCRRAERISVALQQEQAINADVIQYLNRLSDFLFTLARWLNHEAGVMETPWKGRAD